MTTQQIVPERELEFHLHSSLFLECILQANFQALSYHLHRPWCYNYPLHFSIQLSAWAKTAFFPKTVLRDPSWPCSAVIELSLKIKLSLFYSLDASSKLHLSHLSCASTVHTWAFDFPVFTFQSFISWWVSKPTAHLQGLVFNWVLHFYQFLQLYQVIFVIEYFILSAR